MYLVAWGWVWLQVAVSRDSLSRFYLSEGGALSSGEKA